MSCHKYIYDLSLIAGMLVQICNFSTGGLRQKDGEFKASLGYIILWDRVLEQ